MTGPVQRLDAQRVSGEHDTAVGTGDAEGVHATQVTEAGRAPLREHVADHLGVRVGGERTVQRGAQRAVVVDLAVGDHRGPERGDRLPSAVEVDDREPGVPEPGGPDQDAAPAVRPAVLQRPEHRLAEGTRGAQPVGCGTEVMDRGDAAHGSTPRKVDLLAKSTDDAAQLARPNYWNTF